MAQNLVVLRTSPGNANALAAVLDREEWPEVVGTIAGDDTILVISPDAAIAAKLRQKLLGYLETS
jgi:transcriptional regulator of arginine metabolism